MTRPSDPGRRILLDARWLAKGGTGTFTASLIDGLVAHDAPGWALWGPAAVAERWPDLPVVPTDVDPVAAFGQKAAWRVPPARLVFHPHQTRPAHGLPAASCVLDLIQLQRSNPVLRRAMALRLRRTVEAAEVLFTISDAVRDEMVATYDLDPAAITVLRLPVDQEGAARIALRRAGADPRYTVRGERRPLVAVGRFAPHKNHARLIDAFSRTRFAATGGELHLIGGTEDQLDLGRLPALPPGVVVRGVLSAAELETAMADALALVQPSLLEGYGLPVTEALLAAVPVASSPVPAVVEAGPAGVPLLDPTDVDGMADVLDDLAEQAGTGRYWTTVDREAWRATLPTPVDLARQVLRRLAEAGFATRPATRTLAGPVPDRAPQVA